MQRVRRSRAVVGMVAPLPVVAAAVIGGWAWWVALIPVLVVVAIVAELVGITVGAMAALIGTAGIALVVGRPGADDEPKNGVELVAMAALLLVAVLFGTDRPSAD